MQIGASGLPILKQLPEQRPNVQNVVMRAISSEHSPGVVVAISNRNTAVSASTSAMKKRDANQNDTPQMPNPRSRGLDAYENMENGAFLS
jgi:hypothetical protein